MKRIYLFVLLFLTCFFESYSQDLLTGTVKDERSGEAMTGAPVVIKGTSIGTAVDVDGNFSLPAPKEYPFTLLIEFTGYVTKEIEIYELPESPLAILLKNNSVLDEVVVVGYGEQKRKDITGSVASVPLELKTQPVSSPDRLLQGSISGVQVTQTSGQPGAGTSVQIRGNSSLSAGTQPLYVIDGFPIYNDQAVSPNQINGGVVTGPNINPLSFINPSDIESMEVLKDASATGIYGSRGANGVVIINTKKGSQGKASINYDGYAGVQNVTHEIPLANSDQFLALRKQSLANAGVADKILGTNKTLFANGFDTTNWKSVNTNWEKAIIQKQALIQSHSLSIFAGTDKTRIVFAGNYFKQEGVLKNTPFTRYSGRLNIEHEYNSRLKLNSYILASNTNAQVAPKDVVQAALLMAPILPIYNRDGSFKKLSPFETGYNNPLNSLLNITNETKTTSFLGNVSADYKITEGLTARVLVGVNTINNKQNLYLPATVQEGTSANGLGEVGSWSTVNWLNENTLSYRKKLGDHSINAVVGFTQQSQVTNGSIAGGTQFPNDLLSYNSLQNGASQSVTLSGYTSSPASSYSAWALESFLGRVNYSYKEKYLLTATIRSDGSSKFSNGHQWGTFPSGAIAWNLGNEEFIKSNAPVISNLKLRFSAGLTGNQQIPPYQSWSQLPNNRYNFGGTTVAGFAPVTLPNPNLTWEKTAQYDLGLDLGLLNNRINITADVYYKKTNDLLLNVTLPSTAGILNYNPNVLQDQAFLNTGSLQNKGFELAVQSQNLIGKFKWNTLLVYSQNRNEVLSLNNGANQYVPNTALPSVIQVGAPVGSFLVYQTNGLVQPGTPVAQALTINSPADITNPAQALPGQQQYKDIDGDKKITAADRIVVSNQPKFIAGLTNTFSYKGFDLTVFLQTVYGNKIFNQNASILDVGAGYGNIGANVTNFYTPNNTNTDIPAPYPNPASTLSTRYIEDGSYLRLKNISFGYTIPENILSKARIKSLRVYVSAQNWLTWTKYTGFDPEVSSNDQTANSIGVDNGAYPNIKTFLGGLQLSF